MNWSVTSQNLENQNIESQNLEKWELRKSKPRKSKHRKVETSKTQNIDIWMCNQELCHIKECRCLHVCLFRMDCNHNNLLIPANSKRSVRHKRCRWSRYNEYHQWCQSIRSIWADKKWFTENAVVFVSLLVDRRLMLVRVFTHLLGYIFNNIYIKCEVINSNHQLFGCVPICMEWHRCDLWVEIKPVITGMLPVCEFQNKIRRMNDRLTTMLE